MTENVTLSLRYLRQSTGLTQEQLARLLGVNRVTVLRWETGETVPSATYIDAMARALGVHPRLVLDSLGITAA